MILRQRDTSRYWDTGELSQSSRLEHAMRYSLTPEIPIPGGWYDPDYYRPRERKRAEVDDEHRLFTRRCRGGSYQSRIWISHPDVGGFSLNLGLSLLRDNDFKDDLTRWSASKVSKEFVKRFTPGRTIGEVVREMKGLSLIKPDLIVPDWAEGITPSTHHDEPETAEERRERLAYERDVRRWGCAYPLLRFIGLV